MIVKVFSAWKERRFYPANQTAQALCDLLKQICLSERDLQFIGYLGLEIEVVGKEVSKRVFSQPTNKPDSASEEL